MISSLRGALLALALLMGLGGGGLYPAEALARQSMSFSLGERSRAHVARARHHGHAGRSHGRASRGSRARPHAPSRTARRATGGDGEETSAAKAVPGKGFTMENGILTYPAPSRFQPGNLKHR